MSDDLDPGAVSALSEPELRTLSAFVDGELTVAEHEALGARLAVNRRAASVVASYRTQRAALRVLIADSAAETTWSYVVLLRPRAPWWHRIALTVSPLAAGAIIAGLASVLLSPVAPLSAQTAFAEQADDAYVVYAPERRHPVEVTAAHEGALIAWLSKRLDRSLAAPSLQEYGFALLGGRLLPGIAGPAAQFMYENGAGARIALYMSPTSQREIPIRILREGGRRTYSWASDHMSYALSGQVPEGQLHTIAVDVCSELGGHPEKWR
ncbi:anti-sigma factor [Paraburkholderia sp. JHI869]|uniref:anti-sigma factor family protein n=1 Tax=Paraburkholderia sp. JHI869 TaxID=3112959 RepID=UPI00317567F2